MTGVSNKSYDCRNQFTKVAWHWAARLYQRTFKKGMANIQYKKSFTKPWILLTRAWTGNKRSFIAAQASYERHQIEMKNGSKREPFSTAGGL